MNQDIEIRFQFHLPRYTPIAPSKEQSTDADMSKRPPKTLNEERTPSTQ